MEIYHCLKVIKSDGPEKKPLSRPKDLPGIFRSISSQVSPVPDQAAVARFNLENDEEAEFWSWSPERPFASSTPIHAVGQSPLRTSMRFQQQQQRSRTLEDEEDSFAFVDDSLLDGVDLDAIEEAAMQAKNQENSGKRRWDKMEQL
ncbi:hypothetical protein DFQ28_001956 [Apophysomyces sp. BC1034]|nr:hypothetical protein DFQ28_001956 [Apophysomyces sp. BC1034]